MEQKIQIDEDPLIQQEKEDHSLKGMIKSIGNKRLF